MGYWDSVPPFEWPVRIQLSTVACGPVQLTFLIHSGIAAIAAWTSEAPQISVAQSVGFFASANSGSMKVS